MEDFVTAQTVDGINLPIIDVTNPRFALADAPDDVVALTRACEVEEQRRAERVGFVNKLVLRLLAFRSKLLRALISNNDYLDGTSTYVLKLGADNLPPPFNSPLDKVLAKSPHIVAMRLRHQQCAKLLADVLINELNGMPQAPLHLFNIAGGPAIDSLNALLLVVRDRPELLARTITLHVMDVDTHGPTFGARALSMLRRPGRPLAGCDITFKHDVYDWNDPSPLASLVEEAIGRHEVVAASSEGGLFEYGDDKIIISNLAALQGKPIVGSVTNGDALRRRMIAAGKFKLHPRDREEFARIAAAAGYQLRRSEPGPISCQVALGAL